MNIHRYFGAAITALCLAVVASGAHALPYTGLVVFGDSLSDTGNNALAFDAQGAPLPPGTLRTTVPIAGQNFIPVFPYASNRYSNGPVWIDNLAASLGVSAAPSLTGGTNFAFGGAPTGPVGSAFPFSLRDQVGFFLGATGGVAPASNLYVVAGGGNDARDAFQLAAGGGDPSALIAQYVTNMSLMISTLLAAGATDLMVVNVPDIGKTPAIQSFGPAAAALASFLAASMNTALDTVLGAFAVNPGTRLIELDAFALVNSIFNDPAAFGLNDGATACAASVACIASPDGNFFWDGIHPTAAGHEIIAQAALRALPEPSSLLLLAFGLAVFAWRQRKTTI